MFDLNVCVRCLSLEVKPTWSPFFPMRPGPWMGQTNIITFMIIAFQSAMGRTHTLTSNDEMWTNIGLHCLQFCQVLRALPRFPVRKQQDELLHHSMWSLKRHQCLS